MKTFKNIISSLFIMITIVGSSVSSMAQTSGRIYNDAEAFNLKGYVKECVTYNKTNDYKISTISFKSNGEWITEGDYELERDQNNRLLGYEFTDSGCSFDDDNDEEYPNINYFCDSHTFTWDGNKVSTESYFHEEGYEQGGGVHEHYDIDFSYDKNNNIIKAQYCECRDSYTKTYKYTKYDSHGNWIERKVKTIDNRENDLGTSIETRVISYY